MSLTAGTAFVDLVPRMAPGAQSAIAAQTQPLAARIGGTFSSMGRALTAGVTLPIVAIGAGALAAGMKVDEGQDIIRTSTGATGRRLDGLLATFDTVGRRVPNDLADVGTAIADIHRRTGDTGGALERVSQRMLNMTRITGEALAPTIASTTRVFGDWNISSERQAGTLDRLFAVSQRTGIPVQALSDKLVRFGAPLRQLGFSLEESSALLGSFERAGVNSDLVMGSLRISLGKMATAGEPVQETFRRVTDEIKNAGTVSEANAAAVELFGSRAGPDMAAAIREGRFEVGALMADLENSPGSINRAARASDDFGEKWATVKNKLTLALAPLGGRLMDVLGNLVGRLDPVTNFLEKMGTAFGELSPKTQTMAVVLAAVAAAAGPVLMVVGSLVTAIGAIGLPVIAVVAAIGLLVAGLIYAYRNSEQFRAGVQRVFDWLRGPGLELLGQARDAIIAAFDTVVAWVRTNWPAIRGVVEQVIASLRSGFEAVRAVVEVIVGVISNLWDRFGGQWLEHVQTAFTAIVQVIRGAFEAIKGIFDIIVGVLTGDWSRAWDGVLAVVSGIGNMIVGAVRAIINGISGLIGAGMAAVSALWGYLWRGLLGILGVVWDGILAALRGAWRAVVATVRGQLGVVRTIFSAGWRAMAAVVRAVWATIRGAITAAMGGILSFLRGVPGRVRSIASSMFTSIKTFAKSAVDGAVSFVRALPGRIRAIAGSVLDAGKAVGTAALNGIKRGLEAVGGFASDIGAAVGRAVKGSINAVINLLNAGIPNSLGAGPLSIDLPDNPIPRLHRGGIIPGRVGAEVLMIGRAGERVLTGLESRRDAGQGGDSFTFVGIPDPRTAVEELAWHRRTRHAGRA